MCSTAFHVSFKESDVPPIGAPIVHVWYITLKDGIVGLPTSPVASFEIVNKLESMGEFNWKKTIQ